jgi:hypothetical protein
MSNGVAQLAEEALYKPYDQFILFGDSITQMSSDQSMGFGFHPALQDGKIPQSIESIVHTDSLQPTAAAWM